MCLESEAMNPACVKVFDPAKELAFQSMSAGGFWLAGAIVFSICFVWVSLLYGIAYFRVWSYPFDVFKVFTCQLICSGKPCGDTSTRIFTWEPSAVVAPSANVEEKAPAEAVVSGTDVAISKVSGDDREV